MIQKPRSSGNKVWRADRQEAAFRMDKIALNGYDFGKENWYD
jgi:hypothetical protein